MARQKGDRDRLKDFFETIGLKLREKNRRYSVERTNNKEAAERVRLLKTLGVDLDQLQTRLNNGESVQIQVPTQVVPVPLTPQLWSAMVFQHQVAARDLAAAILSNRNAALLCRGWQAGRCTVDFREPHPAMLTPVVRTRLGGVWLLWRRTAHPERCRRPSRRATGSPSPGRAARRESELSEWFVRELF